MATNAETLRKLMQKHGLTRVKVAELTHRSRQAVDNWLAPDEAYWKCQMPNSAMELLKMKLKEHEQ